MSYSEFTLDDLKTKFSIRTDENQEFFASIPAVSISDLLSEILAEQVPLALSVSTEKARSEWIVSPILIEVRRQMGRTVSLFSGVELNVDKSIGLNGTCDFLLSLSTDQLTVTAPIITVVEAKNDNLKSGYAQCIAEMIAAQRFNQQKGKPIDRIGGIVTTGSSWKFMTLEGDRVQMDRREYNIYEPGRIVAIVIHMLQQT